MTRPAQHATGRRRLGVALLLAAGLTLSACGDAADETPTTTPDAPAATVPAPAEPTTEDPVDITERPSPTSITPPGDDDASPTGEPSGEVPSDVAEKPEVQEAVAAEAQRRSVEESEVEIVDYREVTWRDGSLGCPEAGMMYTQALVPGALLVLEVDGEKASYHAGRQGGFSYCADPQEPLPAEEGGGGDT
ncbi:hypothetical protein ACQBAT_13870 [Ornithinimicrobium sp. Y1847]|uniref:hypothetical protein n=1 Tax=Ornithinimicrobium sp. Y1847 TaxID=3405419 RepID=UPI003B6799DD